MIERQYPPSHSTRRSAHGACCSRCWMYYVPAQGEPIALTSAVESHVLGSLPGRKLVYRTWQEYREHLQAMLAGAKSVAMEYVPQNAIPYVSLVDAGTVELVRSLGVEVASSANFIQRFEAVLTPEQIESHRAAGKALLLAHEQLLRWLRPQVQADATLSEYSVQQEFAKLMRAAGLEVEQDEKPLVAVNSN